MLHVHYDVAAALADPFADELDAVAMLLVDGSVAGQGVRLLLLQAAEAA